MIHAVNTFDTGDKNKLYLNRYEKIIYVNLFGMVTTLTLLKYRIDLSTIHAILKTQQWQKYFVCNTFGNAEKH